MTPDAINGLYELLGCVFIGLSVRRLWRDRSWAGLSPWTTIFFTSWGFWNIYFYPSVGAPWSTAGAVATCAANCAYVGLLWKFRRNGGNYRNAYAESSG